MFKKLRDSLAQNYPEPDRVKIEVTVEGVFLVVPEAGTHCCNTTICETRIPINVEE